MFTHKFFSLFYLRPDMVFFGYFVPSRSVNAYIHTVKRRFFRWRWLTADNDPVSSRFCCERPTQSYDEQSHGHKFGPLILILSNFWVPKGRKCLPFCSLSSTLITICKDLRTNWNFVGLATLNLHVAFKTAKILQFHYLRHFQGIIIVFVAHLVVDVLLNREPNSCNVVVRRWLKYSGQIKIQTNRTADWASFHYVWE